MTDVRSVDVCKDLSAIRSYYDAGWLLLPCVEVQFLEYDPRFSRALDMGQSGSDLPTGESHEGTGGPVIRNKRKHTETQELTQGRDADVDDIGQGKMEDLGPRESKRSAWGSVPESPKKMKFEY